MDLLILGASARSAACSALRAGCQPSAVDLFADQDLIQGCPAARIAPDQFPEGLADFAERVEPTRWLYTGALENHPDLVDRISLRHQLLGNPGTVLRAIRDPLAMAKALRSAGLDALEVQLEPDGLPTDGSWLVKPLASAGGRGIRPFDGRVPVRAGSHYYQRGIVGLPLSALYIGNASGATCLGITRQFVGKPGNRFAYRGSLAPWPVSDEIAEQIHRIGQTLVANFGLLGLFGVDLILGRDRVWPIEVNPRYTAAVEVLEWATGRSFLDQHLSAFGVASGRTPIDVQPMSFVGKVILYASRPFHWPESWRPSFDLGSMPEVADVPEPGTEFGIGEPILSVLARGDDPEGCRRNLASRVRQWRRRLRGL